MSRNLFSIPRFRSVRSRLAQFFYGFLIVFTLLLCLLTTPSVAQSRPSDQLLQQSQTLYNTGQYRQAIPLLQQAAEAYQAQGDRLQQALSLSNLSLSYQQIGDWKNAQTTITQSLAIVQTLPDQLSLWAQILDVQAGLQFVSGQFTTALATWQQSATLYEQVGNTQAIAQNYLHQSEALQSLGLYQRSIDTLTELTQILENQSPSILQVTALRQLGDTQLLAGDFRQSRQSLEQSQTIAQNLPEAQEAIARITLSLGNLTRAEANASLLAADLTLADTQQPAPTTLTEATVQRRIQTTLQAYREQVKTAIALYQKAAQTPAIQLQAQLRQFSLQVEAQQWQQANALVSNLQTQLQTQIPTHVHLYNQIEFATGLIQLKSHSSDHSQLIEALLHQTHQQAIESSDRRAQSYALGTLGTFYKTIGALETAQSQTQQAIALAESIKASDMTYRWQHQSGQISQAQQQRPNAIAAYEAAYATLQDLRRDVVTTRLSYQLAFQETAEEPVYKELISLLLQESEPSQEHLKRSREIATSLQVAQLENFLSEPCSVPDLKQIDNTVDQQANTTAVLYPIVLRDRIEIIVKLPQEEQLVHFRSPVPAHDLQRVARSLQVDLEEDYTFSSVKTNAHLLYRWLIEPIQPQLAAKQINTLVFALADGYLRSIPMSVLFDGDRYLVETYATAVTLGLNLSNPTPLPQASKVLGVGLTNPPQNLLVNSQDLRANFAQLPSVNTELDAIDISGLPLTAIRDQEFTQERFNRTLNQAAFPIVHLATHGQFSSDPNSTFLLTSNGAIVANDLAQLFQTRGQIRPDAIELLILNACETATGDQLAALGIAGTAFRAGARGVIASLWTLDDTSGLELTQQLYQHLAQTTKAEALRRAQLALLANPQFEHPRYWATYILLGNWL
jgi:CHAT domain-containing protein/tetratricopeptide (TPR) repeat protein